MNKQRWLDIAEVSDAYRLMPKFVLICLTILYVILVWNTWTWFVVLDPSLYTDVQFAALVGFPSGVVTAVGGMLKGIIDTYIKTGRDWLNASK